MTNDIDQDGWVKLISSDGFSFLVRHQVAMGSPILKAGLTGGLAETTSGTYYIDQRGIVVEKIVEYLMHKKLYENATSTKDVPDFLERIIPEIALELLVAADYYET